MPRPTGTRNETDSGDPPDVVSVIIPVFNVEEFIRECLESLLAQTYAYFEAVMVDDGSSDSSGQICDEFARRDPRFVVIHTANNGIGAAKELGARHRDRYLLLLPGPRRRDLPFHALRPREPH